MDLTPASYKVAPFIQFVELVRQHCRATQDWSPPRQVTYLRSYLQGVPGRSAQALVVEQPYVDRHYLEEYTAYYATMLRPPPSHTTRLHVFASDLTDEDLSRLVQCAACGELEATNRELQESYLGFVTVRPIPSAPVGRTLLVHYGEAKGRQYEPVVRKCTARVMGLELDFDALPFHQQDQGVGACASVALWAAMAKASRDAGMRAPTPYTVTAAATKNWVTNRVVPASSGLELAQLTTAVRELGFAPYTMKASQDPDLFLWTLKVYLRSGIPAVLIVRDGADDHSVVVAGQKKSSRKWIVSGVEPRAVRTAALSRVYVHDDRIGPYVKMVLFAQNRAKWSSGVRLKRVPVDDPSDSKLTSNTWVSFAIYPLYQKLRLTAPELISLAGEVAPIFRHLVTGARASQLSVEAWFALNGVYLRELYGMGADPKRVETFVRKIMLSRYVGIIRWFLRGKVLADVVCDTTDIRRDPTPYAPILGIFFFHSGQAECASKEVADLMPLAVLA